MGGGGGVKMVNPMSLPGGFASDFSAYCNNSEQRLLTYSSELQWRRSLYEKRNFLCLRYFLSNEEKSWFVIFQSTYLKKCRP